MYHAIVIFHPLDAQILSRATSCRAPVSSPAGKSVVAVAADGGHAAPCMKRSIVFLLPSLLVVAGCGLLGGNDAPVKSVEPSAIPGAAPAAPTIDLGKLLAGITDGGTATAAKSPLESAVAQLKAALAGADAKAKVDAATGNADAAGGKKLVDEVLAKFGLGGETVGQITALLQNEQVKAVLGPTLEQLKSLLPAGL